MREDKQQGSARIEPTEETTTRVYIQRAGEEPQVFFLEPGNSMDIVDDGPIEIEVAAMTEEERES